MLKKGDILDRKYHLIRKLGEGGMGAVYEAEHKFLDRQVAIKVLHPQFAHNEQALQRFYREARAASKLGHEGIIEILDVGQAEDGSPYLVMERLTGEALGDLLQRTQKLSPPFAVDVAEQILSVLTAVHDEGIIHRDLKPDNIFLCPQVDGSFKIKILDFGICKIASDEAGPQLTHTGMVMGTPHYMSPEQASGNKTVDHHTDIWSAGTIFYEMLLGRVPYEGSTYNIVISQLLTKDFPAPREIEPLIPPEVEAVVLKAMAREPEDRYGSADEFLAEVRRLRAAVKDLRLEPPPAEQSFESFQGPPVNSEAPTVRTDPLAPTAAMKPESGAVGSADTLAATTRGASKTVMKSRPVALLVIAMLGVVFLGVLIGFGIVLLNLSSRAEERPEAVAVGRVAPPGPSEAPTRPPSEVEPASAPATPSLEATADDEPRVQAASAAEPPSSAPASPVPQPEEPADPEPREAPQGPEPPSSEPPVPVFARPEAPSTPRGAQGSARPEPEPLSQAEIRQGLSRLDAQVRRCLARGGRPPERLTVRVVVDGAGRASYLGASPRPWASANLCLRQVFSGARFRATGAEPVSVTHTYRGNGLMSSPFAQ